MVEILAPLPARPPTPPRQGSRLDQDRSVSPIVAQTPVDSPQLGNLAEAPPSSRGSKRVTFSPWLQTTIQSPRLAGMPKNPKPNSPNVRSPYQIDNRPFKSILKETSSPAPVWSPNVNIFTTESLTMLLESVIQQLAGDSVTSRLDAYMQFFGALRTYDGLPAGKDIAEKLSLITDFIQRDVSQDLINGAPLDTNLANQALKLSVALIWHFDAKNQLSDEFKVFLVEHAITCLQEAKVPKSVLTHYMSILSTQNFGPRVMTTGRVTRILTVLLHVSNHVTGKAIALCRLNIYQRLLTQSKSTFLSHSSLWVEHLIFGLLQPMKDTRVKAISLGFQVSVEAGPNPVLSKNIRELFDRPLEGNRKLITEIRERMSRMMGAVDSGIHVPQIWSITVLLLRSRKWSLDQWDHFKEWVLVLQKCFNCSEPAIKAQAIVGWNRFVYAVSPNESTGRSLLKMLGKPVLSQFERKKSDKSVSPPTQLALSSYYNLLYYTFRPSPPHNYLDLIWEEYISLPCTNTFSAIPALGDSAFRVLASLLWCQQAKVWTETRINDAHKIEVEELPSVDPRWVRSRIPVVLKDFESLFKASVWDEAALEKSNAALAWNSLASALSLASSKEITPSGESMQAVASVSGLLHRLWVAGPASLNAIGEGCMDAFIERFRYLSTTMILSVGGIPFTERLLLRTTDESFQAANTPAHRPSAPGTNLDSPIMHLLRTISSISAIMEPTSAYDRLVVETLEASCRSRLSRGSRLELLQQCAELSITESKNVTRLPLLAGIIWKASTRAAADALQSFPLESARERDGSVSRDYDNVIKILAAGLQFPDITQEWSCLLDSFVRVMRTEKGDQVLANLIVEPIAGFLTRCPVHDTYFALTSLLGHCLSIPFKQEQSGLSTESVDSQQTESPSSLLNLLDSIGRTLDISYNDFGVSEPHGLSDFLESLTAFLGSGVPSSRSRVLKALQTPLSLWVKDAACKIDVAHGVESRILTACRALSSAVLNILQTSVTDELSSLKQFETIICAGLESVHISRTTRFVEFWYSTNTASGPLANESLMGQSASSARSRLSAAGAIPDDQVQVSDNLPSDNQQSPGQSKKKKRLRSSINRAAVNVNSSPVIGSQPPASEVTDSIEPQLPTLEDPEPNEHNMQDVDSGVHYLNNRREVFRMIESIRSSSPANTPSKLGYDTPVHLRKLKAPPGTTDIPLTPTLAPTENDEGYIGSSPTPATRDPTPAPNSNAAMPRPKDVIMTDAPDLPSSPPELSSGSPSPQKRGKRTRSERRKSAKAKKAMHQRSLDARSASNSPVKVDSTATALTDTHRGNVPTDPEGGNHAPQLDERPPSRRLRSALSQSTDMERNLAPAPSSGTPVKATGTPSAEQNSKSKSGSKQKKRKSSKAANEDEQHMSPYVSRFPPPMHIDLVDSSSEDVETQIASQLEQDMEFAMEIRDNMVEQPLERPASAPSSKKRKREADDGRSSTSKDRRRSTRLSSTKDLDLADAENPDMTYTKNTSQESQNVALDQSTSPIRRRSTRGSQKSDEDVAPAVAPPGTQIFESPQEPDKNQPSSQPPAKRFRKSAFNDDKSKAAAEEASSQAKSTRSRARSQSQSRKTRSSRNEVEALSEPAQSATLDEEIAPAEVNLLDEDDAVQEVVPENYVQQKDDPEQLVFMASTEKATDSQMPDMGPSTSSGHASTDNRMGIAEDQEKAHIPPVLLQQVTTAAETQTIPIFPVCESSTSETGLKDSLSIILDNMKLATLGPQALREVDDLLFNIRVEAHEASRRHSSA